MSTVMEYQLIEQEPYRENQEVFVRNKVNKLVKKGWRVHTADLSTGVYLMERLSSRPSTPPLDSTTPAT